MGKTIGNGNLHFESKHTQGSYSLKDQKIQRASKTFQKD